MKLLLKINLGLILSGGALISCTEHEDYDTITSTDKVNIDSVKIQSDTMSIFAIQSITTYSTYTSKCAGFYGYDYVHANNSTREVTAYQYHTNKDCSNEKYVAQNQINFSPQTPGTYTFKFWSAHNNWITKTIVVE
ncbi:hypothetical protein [Chryseobacterium sp.]|uniref:hypothetical protein n=1 Tax=Chryseobacterium sp. TaxID=1871047 RepID=UPI0038910B99